MGLSQKFTDVTQLIARDLQSGGMSRQSLGGGGTAFGWSTSGGMPRTVADFVTTATADGMTFNVTRVTESGTPAAVVGEGAAKPAATQIASETVALSKFAGLGEASLEANLSAAGLAPAILSVLTAGCLKAFEAEAIATLTADAGDSATGATWTAALTNAQARVIGSGGAPGLTIVSADDYGTLLQEISTGAGFAQAPESAIGSFFGSLLHASSQLASGTAFVCDPGAVLAVEHVSSPVVTVDSASLAHVNKSRIVADLVAAVVVVNAPLVVSVSKA